MKKALPILIVISAFSYAIFARQEQAATTVSIALAPEEQREIFELQNQIDKLQLKQENAILRAANEHRVSLKTYQLAEQNGQLIFVLREKK